MLQLFVLKVDEFAGLINFAETDPNCQVEDTGKGYVRIRAKGPMTFKRRELGFGPAVWYGAFTGGLDGKILDFGRDEVVLTGKDAAAD